MVEAIFITKLQEENFTDRGSMNSIYFSRNADGLWDEKPEDSRFFLSRFLNCLDRGCFLVLPENIEALVLHRVRFIRRTVRHAIAAFFKVGGGVDPFELLKLDGLTLTNPQLINSTS
jgi:hypothetical protein